MLVSRRIENVFKLHFLAFGEQSPLGLATSALGVEFLQTFGVKFEQQQPFASNFISSI